MACTGRIPNQDAYIDQRPNLDNDHWITNWIRSQMEPPVERDERCRMWLLKVSNGAKDIKERWALPMKAPGYWKPFTSQENEVAKASLQNKLKGKTDGCY
uniref:Uncharacterized protein n=1 Tax=Hemiselmis andersenii TaxID=464988 RepID=A0A6U2IQP6_HEMAN|mmetsp:Transcript_7034/g.16098  ORF Transcript_7034/g.16098 Transcript_7034/m.16098 type:complete len:100 (-) Transcript_7034:70-369(-)|eukprot:CAMPEP_0114126804 /NCGR_PEP_ID=MMETSP0043_2-20121206/10023_1 /TAXON_ID=464988 /ORGANISM="Hemiselmis andersenii, Strain CCMP644" /LENGTH=99 /DNA_ID=CAMNT_0001219809 /DNA_START=59 /DNA_END=358 /DNA_ORIENTATION=-